VFFAALAETVPADAALKVVVGVLNPNRVELLRAMATRWPNLSVVASNAGAKLVRELWDQRRQPPSICCGFSLAAARW
jgi:hypothetical protein